MSVDAYTADELAYLREPVVRLGRIATVGPDGTPHVVPVGWHLDPDDGAIEVGGRRLEKTKKYRDAKRTGRASIVIDDLESVEPWIPRGIEIRGRVELMSEPRRRIRIHPERIVSWGIDRTGRVARDVPQPIGAIR